MGETRGSGPAPAVDIAMFSQVELVMSDGQVKMLPLRLPAPGQCAIIDWFNCTVHEDTFIRTAGTALFTPDDFIREASRVCETIFGFGVTGEHGKIMNFYKNSWTLGDGFGFLCYGGQRDTLMFVLNGTGCLNALPGWERRFYHFLTSVAIRPSITRCDLAHDDFDGKFINVEWAEAQWTAGNMSCGGNPPDIECLGNWRRPNGKGRTVTIGVRTSGKFARFYEKGKKEGDKQSPWTRAEVELKSADRVIPLDILLYPSDYFLGAYPCLAFLQTDLTTPERIKVKQKVATIAYQRALSVVKTQMGKYLTFFRHFFNDDQLLLATVCHPDPNVVPDRIKNTLKGINTCTTFMHDFEQQKLRPDAIFAMPWDAISWAIAQGKPTLTGGQWDVA